MFWCTYDRARVAARGDIIRDATGNLWPSAIQELDSLELGQRVADVRTYWDTEPHQSTLDLVSDLKDMESWR